MSVPTPASPAPAGPGASSWRGRRACTHPACRRASTRCVLGPARQGRLDRASTWTISVRRACAAGGRVAVVALADPYGSVWQGTVSAGRCLVVRIRGTAGVTVGRIDRVPGSEDGRFERGGPGRTCDGAG